MTPGHLTVLLLIRELIITILVATTSHSACYLYLLCYNLRNTYMDTYIHACINTCTSTYIQGRAGFQNRTGQFLRLNFRMTSFRQNFYFTAKNFWWPFSPRLYFVYFLCKLTEWSPSHSPAAGPARAKSVDNYKRTLFHVKMTVFLLPPYWATGIAQMQAWPVRLCIRTLLHTWINTHRDLILIKLKWQSQVVHFFTSSFTFWSCCWAVMSTATQTTSRV